jgi:hypothetical protein
LYLNSKVAIFTYLLAHQPTGQLRSQHEHTKQTDETKTKAQHNNNNNNNNNNNTLHGAGSFLI